MRLTSTKINNQIKDELQSLHYKAYKDNLRAGKRFELQKTFAVSGGSMFNRNKYNMKKLNLHSTVLLFLMSALLFTPAMFAQETKSNDAPRKTLMKRLWEIARAKHSTQPFVILTPTDLESISAEERSLFS